MLRNRKLLLLVLVPLLLLFPSIAAAADDLGAHAQAAHQPSGEVATGANLALVLLGMATPLVAYLLNHFAPWASEQAKGVVQAVAAAGVGAVYQALSAGNFGWNTQTLLAVLTVMASALASHIGYRAAGINEFLGAGTNHDGTPTTSRALVKPKRRSHSRSAHK